MFNHCSSAHICWMPRHAAQLCMHRQLRVIERVARLQGGSKQACLPGQALEAVRGMQGSTAQLVDACAGEHDGGDVRHACRRVVSFKKQ